MESMGRTSLVIGIMAICFLTIGLRGLITRRPFLIPARFNTLIMMLGFSLSIIPSFGLIFSKERDFLHWYQIFPSLIFVLIIIIVWKTMTGYEAIGVTEESFRNALHEVLQRLNLPFKESVSRFHLTSIDAELKATMGNWPGVAFISMDKRQHRPTLKNVAQALKEHYANFPGRINRGPGIIYTVFGVVELIGALYLGAWYYGFDFSMHKYVEPDRIVGKLNWVVREVDTGKTIADGGREVRVRDVRIEKVSATDDPFFPKKIWFNMDFYLEMSEFPQAERSGKEGFGLNVNRRFLDTFCWEWFNIDSDNHATKLQESGELAIDIKKVNSQWEITRTEFLSDVTLRAFPRGAIASVDKPKWRVTILKGSYVNWPSLIGKTVVPNN
jgi:hypothetical protein